MVPFDVLRIAPVPPLGTRMEWPRKWAQPLVALVMRVFSSERVRPMVAR